MGAHFTLAHGGADKIGLKLRAEVALAPHEEFHVKQLLEVGLKNVKKAPCSDTHCTFGACAKKQKTG